MEVFFRWYAAWLWQDVDAFDALVLRPPLSAPDDPAAFARELYHRYLAHLLCIKLWNLEWLAIAASAIVLLLLAPTIGRAPFGLGLALAIIGIVAGPLAARFALGFFLGPNKIEPDIEAARALVRRVCLRDIPEGTPADLIDPWRHGWTTVDGRPVSAEIAEIDLRRSEPLGRAKSCLLAGIAVGLVPASISFFGIPALVLVLLIAVSKSLRDQNPAGVRAHFLDAAAAGTAEGAAWALGGATRWAARVEEARKAQLTQAAADKTPVMMLGTSLGVLAARGDFLAPSANLDMVLSLQDLMQHLLVLGGTGSGKTAGFLRPLCKQLGALKGVGLVVMDGKGSLPGEVAKFIPDMEVIDPSSKRMSLVEGLTPTEVVATVVDLLGRSEGKDRFFQESATALMRHAAVLAKRQGKANWSLSGIWKIASDGPDKEMLGDTDVRVPEVNAAIAFFTKEWPKVEPEVKSSILATLRAWYTTITGHPDTLKWADTQAGKSEVDVTTALKGARIGILAQAHRYGQAGPVVMALLKARIFASIRDRADKGMKKGETPVVMVMDEAQEITTEQDSLILGIARSLSLVIVASTQTVEGIQARLGEKEAAYYLTLFGSVMALQNRSARTAQAVAERLGATYRPLLETVSGVPPVRRGAPANRIGQHRKSPPPRW